MRREKPLQLTKEALERDDIPKRFKTGEVWAERFYLYGYDHETGLVRRKFVLNLVRQIPSGRRDILRVDLEEPRERWLEPVKLPSLESYG